MINAPDPDAPPSPAHTVSVEGPYGSATWRVSAKLYDVLPRDKRDAALSVTGEGRIDPFFKYLCERLLAQAGCSGVSVPSLNPEWSLQTVRVECGFGEVFWSIGQGLWDALPPDQRDNLLEFVQDAIHGFFEQDVLAPLYRYAQRTFLG